MILNNIFKKPKGPVEDCGGGSRAPQFRHACPLHERCGIANCSIGDVHATHCTRYPSLKDEIKTTGENQALNMKI